MASTEVSGPPVDAPSANHLRVVAHEANHADDLFEVLLPRVGVAVVVLLGEHDLTTRGALHELLTLLVAGNDLVVVDLSQVEFIDASTLGAFVRADEAARLNDHRFRLQLGAEGIVRRILDVTDLVHVLDCAPSRKAAVSWPPMALVRPTDNAPAA